MQQAEALEKLLDSNRGNDPSSVENSNTWSDALENVADAVLTCVPGGEMALAIKKAIKDPTYLSKMSNAELVGLLASTALDFTPTGKVLKAAKNSKFLVKFGDRLRRNLSRRLKAATHACSTQVSFMGTAGLGAFLFPEMVEQVGKVAKKMAKSLHFGKFKVAAEVFHRQIKPNILKKAGDFSKVVGRNPDIKLVNGKIKLTGTGPFKGKSFSTGLDAADFLK